MVGIEAHGSGMPGTLVSQFDICSRGEAVDEVCKGGICIFYWESGGDARDHLRGFERQNSFEFLC